MSLNPNQSSAGTLAMPQGGDASVAVPATTATKSIATDLPLVLHTRVVCGTGGGPDKTILNSPRFLPNLGYRSICAYLHPPGDTGFQAIVDRAAEWQAPLISIPDSGPFDISIFRKLREVCREQRVAIWHGHDYKSNLAGLLARRRWPMKLVTTVHGWVRHTIKTPLYYAVDRWCLPRYDKVICVSTDLYERCLQLGVREDRCVLIENAIDTSTFHRRQSTQESKRALGLSERFLIGAVGRLSAEKGFDVLIRAVDALVREGVDVSLAIIGDGDERGALEELIRSLSLADRIFLLRFRSDLNTIYEAMDVFALSSRREGLPNVVLEAMAMDVPVVATRIAGLPNLIAHEENGLLVEPDDVVDLAANIRRLYSDREARERLGHAGRDTIEQRHSFAKRMEKVAAVYDEVLGAAVR
jgi:glycosyltransferase involved in cell wall biosynthesis